MEILIPKLASHILSTSKFLSTLVLPETIMGNGFIIYHGSGGMGTCYLETSFMITSGKTAVMGLQFQ